ncbi:unnamed protein product, partial [Rotaria sp. Silwood1]
ILDESDEILCHGKKLNYTLGSPKPLDGGPTRWRLPFLFFNMIFNEEQFCEKLKVASQLNNCPVVFQENFRPIKIVPDLSREFCEILLSRFNQKTINIVDNGDENCGCYEDFIRGESVSKEDKIIKLLVVKSQNMLNSLLLAKAWLHHDILYHVMNYRYRVEYELSGKREKEIAISFRGKDLSSENSEFTHPDIMIDFTILSYLYRGLDLEQVRKRINQIKK